MQLEVITNDRRAKEVKEAITEISMVPKLKRIVINRASLDIMVKNYKQNFNSVVLLKNPESNESFWIRPCVSEQVGARKLSTIGKNTKIISCRPLFYKLNWLVGKTSKFPTTWDKKNNALKVELE
jgi:hypothetical protein